jgi:ribosomal protein S18 acetylase RimI-like enzyme
MTEFTLQLTWTENLATQEQISEHLRGCDRVFVQKLTARMNLDTYSKKLFEKAFRFEAWEDRTLVGLVAAYFSGGFSSSVAFVTNVSVLKSHSRLGIAGNLLGRCSDRALKNGKTDLRLEVDRGNMAAISLYQKMGYSMVEDCAKTIIMHRQCGTKK